MPHHYLTEKQILDYEHDGCLILRNIIDTAMVNDMRVAIDQQIKKHDNDDEYYKQCGRYRDESGVNDVYMFHENTVFHDFIKKTPLSHIAADAMQSQSSRLFYDNLLVKYADSKHATPWHHDTPYLPLIGKQICRTWVPFDAVDETSSTLQLALGSHTTNSYYMPVSYGHDFHRSQYQKSNFQTVPTEEDIQEKYEIIAPTVNPGDMVVFHPHILHCAKPNTSNHIRRANSLFWCGDDVVYAREPWHLGLPKSTSLQNGESITLDQTAFPIIFHY